MKSPYLSNPNILAHPDRVVQSVALDMTAQDSYLAGSPISAEGKLANDQTAIGILLYDVHKAIGGRTGVVVISGRIDQAVAAEHSGVTITDDCKAALIDISFTGDGSRMGGGGLTELPEGYPYKEKSWDAVVENISYTPAINAGNYSHGQFHPSIGTVLWNEKGIDDYGEGRTFKVIFDGVEYICECKKQYSDFIDVVYIGNLGLNPAYVTEHGWEDTGEPFCFSVGGDTGLGTRDAGEHTVSVYLQTETIHPMAPEFLPKKIINADPGTADMSYSEVKALIDAGYTVEVHLLFMGKQVLRYCGQGTAEELNFCTPWGTDPSNTTGFNVFFAIFHPDMGEGETYEFRFFKVAAEKM